MTDFWNLLRRQWSRGYGSVLVRPTAEELLIVEKITEAPQDFVRSALDPEESSRIEIEDNHILVLVNVPVNHEEAKGEYDLLPLGIIVTPDYIVTICQEYDDILQNYTESRYKYFSTYKRTRFLFSASTALLCSS